MNTRKGKVQQKLVKSTWKESLKPILTLSGDWMKDAGFNIGTEVKIIVERNKLTILTD